MADVPVIRISQLPLRITIPEGSFVPMDNGTQVYRYDMFKTASKEYVDAIFAQGKAYKVTYPNGETAKQVAPANDFRILITFTDYPNRFRIIDGSTGNVFKTYNSPSSSITADITQDIIDKYEEINADASPKRMSIIYESTYGDMVVEDQRTIGVVYPCFCRYLDNEGDYTPTQEVILSPWEHKNMTMDCFFSSKAHKMCVLIPKSWEAEIIEARNDETQFDDSRMFVKGADFNISVVGNITQYTQYATSLFLTANEYNMSTLISAINCVYESKEVLAGYGSGGSKASSRSTYINVKDYGALGDGVKDDRQAIYDAIEYLRLNGGGTLFFPTGIYRITEGFDYHPIALTDGYSYAFSNVLKSVSFVGEGIPEIRATVPSGGNPEDFRISSVHGSCIYYDPVAPEYSSRVQTTTDTLESNTWYRVSKGKVTYHGVEMLADETFATSHVHPIGAYSGLRLNTKYQVTEGVVTYKGNDYQVKDYFTTDGVTDSCVGTKIGTGTVTIYDLTCSSTEDLVLYKMSTGNHFTFMDCQNIEIRNMGFYSDYPLYNEHYCGGVYFKLYHNDNNPHHFMENVWITCSGTGLVMATPMMVILNNVKVSLVLGSCFTMYGGTCTSLTSCYAITSPSKGFSFTNMTYFELNTCASETCDYGYYFQNCNAGVLNGCGAEEIRTNTSNCVAFYFCGNSHIVGNGCYNTRKYKKIWHIREDGGSVFDRTAFKKNNVKHPTSPTPDFANSYAEIETLINNVNAIRCNLKDNMRHRSLVRMSGSTNNNSTLPLVTEYDETLIPFGVVLLNNEWNTSTGMERLSQSYVNGDGQSVYEEVWVVRDGEVRVRASESVTKGDYLCYLTTGSAGDTSVVPANYYEYMGRWIETLAYSSVDIFPRAIVKFL